MLVVEDDEGSLRCSACFVEGYEVRGASDGAKRSTTRVRSLPDLVVLDLGLPRLDASRWRRGFAPNDDVPILMLTARDAPKSRVEGLDRARTTPCQPFERQELLARLRALLRRRPPRGGVLVVGDLQLNPDTHEVLRGERPSS